MTLVEDIIAAHADRARVSPGDLVVARVDRVYVQDGNSPTVAKLFREHEFTRVFDPSRIGIFFDHSVLVPDIRMADRLREAERFASDLGLQVFRAGTGISHVVALEEGWFEPGSIVIGADSHTCTGGAMQCLALGMGASDVVYAMVTGETWLRVPETVVVETCGAPGQFTTAKDLMLHLMAEHGEVPFLYRSIEWTGDWIDGLSMDSAATIANMTVELGAKCAFLPPRPGAPAGLRPTGQADKRIRVDLASLPPYIARPHSPLSGRPIDACRGQPIDYVFVGSCANSRLEDIAEVARVLDGRYVHSKVHMIVTPGSQRVYLEALKRGYVDTLVRAGALVTPAGCGACVGTQGTIPATGSRVLSTMNRNFRGRMGNPNADIWLSSPVVAATAAVRGEIPGMKDLR